MARLVGLLLLFHAGCGLGRPCVTVDLDKWCHHNESARGPDVALGAPPCEAPSSDGALPDAEGELLIGGESGGYTAIRHYFDAQTGEHLATEYLTDVNIYCGGFSYWYGTRL